jgi:hypothetical protein
VEIGDAQIEVLVEPIDDPVPAEAEPLPATEEEPVAA